MRKQDKILKVSTALPLCIALGLVVGSLIHSLGLVKGSMSSSIGLCLLIGCVVGAVLRRRLQRLEQQAKRDETDGKE